MFLESDSSDSSFSLVPISASLRKYAPQKNTTDVKLNQSNCRKKDILLFSTELDNMAKCCI